MIMRAINLVQHRNSSQQFVTSLLHSNIYSTMKWFALFCIFLLFIQYSVQVPKYEKCLSEVLPTGDRQRCIKVVCTSNNKFKVEECSCDKDAGQHLGERHSEYPACCPQCSRNRKQ